MSNVQSQIFVQAECRKKSVPELVEGTDFFIYSKLKVIDNTREVSLLIEYV